LKLNLSQTKSKDSDLEKKEESSEEDSVSEMDEIDGRH